MQGRKALRPVARSLESGKDIVNEKDERRGTDGNVHH
jgi:hypothetical protein